MPNRICSIDGCPKPSKARGWCDMHYARWVRSIDPHAAPIIIGDDVGRFWSKVDKCGPAPSVGTLAAGSGACWLWTGARKGPGYGRAYAEGREIPAHRYSYELNVGTLVAGMHLDHLCRNPPCVNPAHLEQVTPGENIRRGERGVLRPRATHCPQGHPYDESNTRFNRKGCAECLECARSRAREYQRRKRAG